MSGDLAGGQTLGVQRQDRLVEPVDAPGVLGHHHRLERAGPVPWGRQSHVADLGGHRLGRGAVPGVGAPPARRVALLVAEMLGQFGGQAPLEHRLDHLGQEPALAGQLQVAGVNLGHQLVEQAGINQLPDRRTGILVEYDQTPTIFTNPSDKRTEDYVTGRFG